jgi:broad specificity phosphatase PhoE
MGRLLLVRHAQASFLQQNYDKLSELGETQARLLGEYWVRQKVRFDRVGCGPCVRHQGTAEIVADAYRKADLDFPALTILSEFDEYSGDAVLQHALPDLLVRDARIRELHCAFENSRDSPDRRRTFQRLFQAVIGMWVDGQILLPGIESWDEFCVRVNRGLTAFLSAGKSGETLAVFTSGGPISLAVQKALGLSPRKTLEVSWMARNCSFSEFLFSDGRFTMSTFNSYPHLDDLSLHTYR